MLRESNEHIAGQHCEPKNGKDKSVLSAVGGCELAVEYLFHDIHGDSLVVGP